MDPALKPLENASLPTTPAALFRILQSLDITYELYEHAPIFTVEEGEYLKQNIPGLHCRNLFLCDKKKKMFLVVVPNDTQVDLKTLPEKIDSARLSFGSAERLWQYLGIRSGSVCPFTAINDKNREVTVVLDADMMKADLVCYHPLDNAMTIALTPADLLKFLAHTGHTPLIVDFNDRS